jgi:leucyl-tRNA synthetase
MELVNAMYGMEAIEGGDRPEGFAPVMRFAVETVVLLLSPIVPHFAEELWAALGKKESVLLAAWPAYREDALTREELVIVVQVNGKLRSRFTVAAGTDDATLKKMALEDEKAGKFIGEKTVKKVIVVKGKLVNIVV